MFPASVLKQIDNDIPKINPLIAKGIACTHLKSVEEYVDSVFRSASIGFPTGLTYEGCKRCTPLQEFHEATKKKGNKSVFDVAKSDVYLMEYKFNWMGQPIKSRYLQLPYVTQGGTIYLGGSRFVISPVLADKVISVGLSSVFVRLLKAKLTFNRVPHFFFVKDSDGDRRENIQVAFSEIYNKKSKGITIKPSVKAQCTLTHYLFCKYGFTKTFEIFTKTTPYIGTDDINETNYPLDQYVIVSSSKLKPKGYGKSYYVPTEIKIAIKKEDYTSSVKNLIAGFYYIADHFPIRIKPEYVNNTRLWMVLLGLLIWNESTSEGKLHSDISDHINSLDEYMDAIVSDKLKEIGFPCKDLYELFYTIIEKFDYWLLSSDDRVNTMYNKELSVLYYVLYDIIESIFKLYFKLKAAGRKPLDAKKIENIMQIFLKPGTIYKITRECGAVSTTSTSGDNMFLKITSLLVPQTGTNKKQKKDRGAITDPSKRLHASIADIGSYCALPKSSPDGLFY